MTESRHPVVSIITPTYNHERFLGACVESVLAQSYPYWEQIIIDDGSTDATRAVIEQYNDPRIRHIFQENHGIEALAHTYNRAFSASHGSLIAILEGDDLWPSDKLARTAPLFDHPEIELCHGAVLDIDDLGTAGKTPPRSYRERANLPRSILFNDPVGSATGYLLSPAGQSLIAASTVVMRRTALEAIGGFQYVPGQYSPDIPTFVRLSVRGKFHYLPQVLGFRRRHLGSATVQYLVAMQHAAREYGLTARKDPDLRLTAEEQRLIERSWDGMAHHCEFDQGRMSLINCNWKAARKQFTSSLNSLNGRILLGASLGWIFSWLHMDMECVFRLAGRASFRQEKV